MFHILEVLAFKLWALGMSAESQNERCGGVSGLSI